MDVLRPRQRTQLALRLTTKRYYKVRGIQIKVSQRYREAKIAYVAKKITRDDLEKIRVEVEEETKFTPTPPSLEPFFCIKSTPADTWVAISSTRIS